MSFIVDGENTDGFVLDPVPDEALGTTGGSIIDEALGVPGAGLDKQRVALEEAINPLGSLNRAVVTGIGNMALAPGAALVSLLQGISQESTKPKPSLAGAFDEVSKQFTDTMSFIPQNLIKSERDKRALNILSYAMKPFEMAGQGWGEIGKLTGIPYAEPILGTMGEAAAVFGLPGIPKAIKNIKGSNWYRMATISERAVIDNFVDTLAADIESGNLTGAQIREAFKNPANREALLKKYQGVGAEEPPSGAAKPPSAPTIRTGGVEPEGLLPPGQGFELRPRPDELKVILDSLSEQGTPALPGGQGFELRPRADEVKAILDSMNEGEGFTMREKAPDVKRIREQLFNAVQDQEGIPVEYTPKLSTKGKPFVSENRAKAAAIKSGLEEGQFDIVQVGDGYGIKKVGRVTGKPSIIEEALAPEVITEPPAPLPEKATADTLPEVKVEPTGTTAKRRMEATKGFFAEEEKLSSTFGKLQDNPNFEYLDADGNIVKARFIKPDVNKMGEDIVVLQNRETGKAFDISAENIGQFTKPIEVQAIDLTDQMRSWTDRKDYPDLADHAKQVIEKIEKLVPIDITAVGGKQPWQMTKETVVEIPKSVRDITRDNIPPPETTPKAVGGKQISLQGIDKKFFKMPREEFDYGDWYITGLEKGIKKIYSGRPLWASKDEIQAEYYANQGKGAIVYSKPKNGSKILDLTDDNELIDFAEKINKLAEEGQPEFQSIIKEYEKLGAKDISEVLHPADIVEHGGIWDETNFTNTVWDVFGYDFVKTHDGGIFLNPDAAWITKNKPTNYGKATDLPNPSRPPEVGKEAVQLPLESWKVITKKPVTPAAEPIAETLPEVKVEPTATAGGKISIEETVLGKYSYGTSIYKDGKLIGEGTFTIGDDGVAKVGMIRAIGGRDTIAPTEWRNVLGQLKEKYPQITKLEGDRVTRLPVKTPSPLPTAATSGGKQPREMTKETVVEIPKSVRDITRDNIPPPETTPKAVGGKQPELAKLFKESERGSMPLDHDSEIVAAIRKAGTKLNDSLPHLENLGRSIYESGKTKYFDWQRQMKTALGDMWERFKGKMQEIWKRISKPLRNERGAVGGRLRETNVPIDNEKATYIDTKGTNKEIIKRAVDEFNRWPEKVTAADGSNILLKNPEGGSLSDRVKHLVWDNSKDILHIEKAKWLPNVRETLKNAAVRLVDYKTGNRIYVRAYNDGTKHMVVVNPEGTVIEQQSFKGGLITQFPYVEHGKQDSMKIDWERQKGEGRSQENPNPTSPTSTIPGSQQEKFRNYNTTADGNVKGKVIKGVLNERGRVDISGLVELFKKDRKGFEKVLNPKDMSVFERVFSSPAWLRERYPSMEAAFSRQIKRQEDRATILYESIKQNEPAINLKKKPKEFKKLTKLIWAADGRKFKGVDQARFVWDGDNIKGLNLKHYKELEVVLKAKNYPPEVIDAFIAIRKDMDRDLIRVYRAMKKMPDIEESTIAEFRKEMGMVQNYFPHHRYGSYYIRGFDKDGNVLYRTHFNDLMGLNRKLNRRLKLVKLRKEYPEVTKWETGKNQALPEDVYSFPIPVEAMEQIIKAAANRIQDPQLRKAFEEILPEAVSDTMKARGFGSHMIKRENIPGFEKEDILRVMYDYKAGLAGWLTKMQAAHDFSAMLRDINAKKSPQEWSYVSRYVRDMLQNTDALDRASDNIRALVYLKYIAGNIKTGVVNLTQNFIAGIPVLSMETRYVGPKWIKGAGDDLLGYLTKKKNLAPDEVKLLDELYIEGTNRDNFTQEMKGRMTGSLMGLNRALDILGLTMSVPERFNRSSLSLTAFRVAINGKITRKSTLDWLGLKPGQKATYEQAKEFAKRIVDRAHFVYGKANLAEPLRGTTMGKIGRALYALQSFTHNLLQLWGYMLRSGGRGYQAFARSLLAQLAIGGFMAIPLIKTFAWAMRKYLGVDPQEEVRKRTPKGPEGNENLYRDMVVYGFPGGAGIDISGSLGIDFPNFKDNPIAGIGGAPYSMFVESPMKAAEAISSGAPGRAAEYMAPTAIANVLTAKRMYSEGKKSVSGKILPFPGEAEPQKITAMQAILKGFGFQPTKISNSNEAYRGLKELEVFAKAKQTKFVNRYANAYPDDLKEMVKVTEEVRAWNEKVADAGKPEFVVNLKAVRNRLRPSREPKKFRPMAAERMELYR